MDLAALSLSELCGQLLVVGFEGLELPPALARALARGERSGVILFRRNLRDIDQVAELSGAVHGCAHEGLPPLLGVDEEGGRVTRLPAPCLKLPPMRLLGSIDDIELTRAAARAVGAELRALGFTVNFAPVLDVDSNPLNPIIGDRSFGTDTGRVVRHAMAFAQGLADERVTACGKHFPGHGDTSQDSHLELPWVGHSLARLHALELVPFAAAVRAAIPALMTAHVVFRELDPTQPATLSGRIATELLRGELGFEGVLFSDDMEMGAIAATGGVGQAAVRAVRAGCDALLVCRQESLQQEAFEGLLHEAERDRRFVDRCRDAVGRLRRLRSQHAEWDEQAGFGGGAAPRVQRRELVRRTVGSETSRALLERLEQARATAVEAPA